MPHAFIAKLEHATQLSDEDKALLEAAAGAAETLPARTDLAREGERPSVVHVVLEGFACRYKLLPNGDRQIMAWLAPGDTCDLHVAILGEMDHSVATLTRSRIARIAPDAVESLTRASPAIARAFWWSTLVDEAVLREWLAGMGRRDAEARIGHLFCELLVRLQAVGLAGDNEIDFPVTQGELADTVGLSPVHVNRVIQKLRQEGLIAWEGRRLRIEDFEALAALADFDPNYLHLRERSRRTAPALAAAGK